jgi:type VI secretion system secreted protein Hcp
MLMNLILLQPGDPGLLGGDGDTIASSGGAVDGPTGNCIEIVSLHQGIKQATISDVSNSARTSGRPVITELTLVKYLDRYSVKFYDACLRAATLGRGPDQPTLLYLMNNSGERSVCVMKIALRDAMISEIQLQTHPDDMPTEQFKLNFTEIVWSSVQPGANAALDAGWSLARNKPASASPTDR